MTTTSITILFDAPFWVGIIERISSDGLQVCKITFGGEPSEREVMEYMERNWHRLKFSKAIEAEQPTTTKNPKRMLREVRRQTADKGIGTKSQQALKQQQEENKTERKQTTREKREEKKERKYELRQIKKKEKQKGH